MFSFFVDHFNSVKLLSLLFKKLHSLLSVGEFCFRCCASFRFLMAVICSPSCTVLQLALHRVCKECLLTKNGTRNFQVIWIWNWFCCLPTVTVVCKQLTSKKCHLRIIWEKAVTFNFSTEVVQLLIMNLKPIQNIFTGGNTFGSGIKQFFIGN